ncbi:MAG: tetratricopeptide repeat protein, partial [Armatimonadetes bacterium]|nr:tetratricopeptide repeat protein [Armatimonadota bacterium]
MKRALLHSLLVASALGACATLSVVVAAKVRQPSMQFTTQIAAGAQKLFESGQREEARDALEEALKIAPGNLIVRRELAMQLAASGQTEAAAEQLRLVLDASPRDAGAARKLAEMLYAAGDRERAITYLRLACDWEPGNGMHWITLANWLLGMDDPRAALGAARKAVEMAQGVPEAHLALGFSLWETGDVDGAENAFRDALALEPDNASARSALS